MAHATGISTTLQIVIAAGLVALKSSPDAAAQSADEEVEPLDADAVGEVAACAVCHEADGRGNPALDAPRIGGMPAWYTSRQLENFRKGVRGGTDEDVYGTQMHAIALGFEDTSVIDELGRYFETLDPPPASPTIEGDADNGEQLYTVCAPCHGPNGEGGEQFNTPSLVGQYDWYTLRQLDHFRNGLRGSDNRDTFGAQMAPIMQTVTGEQALIDLTAYINTFSDSR